MMTKDPRTFDADRAGFELEMAERELEAAESRFNDASENMAAAANDLQNAQARRLLAAVKLENIRRALT